MITTTQLANQCDLIDIYEPTSQDKQLLRDNYHVSDDMLGYAYDIDERARIEFDEDSNLMMIIYDVVVDTDDNNMVTDPTAPVTFLFNRSKLLLFTTEETHFVVNYIHKLQAKLIEEDDEPLDIILLLIYALASRYFQAIHSIDKARQKLQRSLKNKVTKSSVTQLMTLQTQLVYYLTSLRSNSSLLLDMQHERELDIDEQQEAKLDDDLIELQQGLEMADMTSDVIEHVSDAYTNVLDIELNSTMKFLTIYSVLLAIPNIVFAFYGQNVSLPFVKSGWPITIVISIIATIIIFSGYLVHQKSKK